MIDGREEISVVIAAINEGAIIGRCIDSVWWADEVIVVDAGSTDGTREVAEERGARVVSQDWLGFSAQKNVGASAACHDWILSLDSDEVVTPELALAIQECLKQGPDPRAGFVLSRRNMFLDALLPNMDRKGKWQVRMYNRLFSEWDTALAIHESVRCVGERIVLEGDLLHWRPSGVGVQAMTFARNAGPEAEVLSAWGVRGSAMKVVYRPIMRFVWCVLVRGGWRAGGRGIVYSALKASAEIVTYASLYERVIELSSPGVLPPTAPPGQR